MRTTLDIDETVLKELRELQRREGGTLGAIASKLLAEAMARKPRRGVAAFSWTSQPMAAIVDLEDRDLVYTMLDRPGRAAASHR